MKMLERLIEQMAKPSLAEAHAYEVGMAYKWFNDNRGRNVAQTPEFFPCLIPNTGKVWMETTLQTHAWKSSRSHIGGSGANVRVGKLNGFSGTKNELTLIMEAECKEWAPYSKVHDWPVLNDGASSNSPEYFISYELYSWVTLPKNAVLWLGTWGAFTNRIGHVYQGAPQQLWILDKLAGRADDIMATLMGFFFSSCVIHLADDNNVVITTSRGNLEKLIEQRSKKGIPNIQFHSIDTSRFRRRVRRELSSGETEISCALGVFDKHVDQWRMSSDNPFDDLVIPQFYA